MSLLIIGSTGVDVILPRVARLPDWPTHLEFTAANLVLLKHPPLVTVGGNGGNAAYVAASCGAAVELHTNLGDDALGALAAGWLNQVGCVVAPSAQGVRTPLNVTAADSRLRRATFFYAGTRPQLPARRLTRRQPSYVLICGCPHPAQAASVQKLRAWRQAGIRTAYDIGPLLGEKPTLALLQPLLAELDLFIANEHEVMTVTGARSLNSAVARLRQHFSGDVILKLGKAGVRWVAAGGVTALQVPGLRVKAVNTVGAGDAFNGALLAALDRQADMPAALRAANRVAAEVVRSGGIALCAFLAKRARRSRPTSISG